MAGAKFQEIRLDMWMLLLFTGLLAGSPDDSGNPVARAHPFLFITRADAERARSAFASGELAATWGRELAEEARAERIEDLPPLQRDWWEADREKPWRETYPQIFHHTWAVPARWADLAERCALASLLLPDSELGEKGRRVLLGLSDFTFEFEHFDVGMNYTVWGVRALKAYDVLYASFLPEERARMDAFFRRMADAVVKNDRFWVEKEPGGALNNHYAWHKLGLAAYGLFYDRPELVDAAIEGPKGVDVLMRHGFRDDGLWLEGSIPYQFAATAPLLVLAEILENAGYPRKLYGRETGDGRSLERAYDALFGLLLPDRTLPPIGDSYARRPHLGSHPDWEILYRRFRDPRYAWLLGDYGRRSAGALFDGVPVLPPADPPAPASRLWPEHGYVALRSVEGRGYWSGRGWTLFATFSAQPVHSNADKLSVLLFADGHLWLPDCEARTSAEHAFSSRVQSELNRATLCHNTVLVGGRSQQHPDRRLDLLEYHVLPDVKRVTLGDLGGRLYPGVRQQRTCIVREEYVLDVFQLSAEEERDFAWVVHVDGTPEDRPATDASPASRPALAPLPEEAPWSYLKEPRVEKVSGHFGETHRHDSGTFRVDVFWEGPAELIRCGFPRDDGPDPETIPTRILRSRRISAWYAAVYRSGGRTRESLKVQLTPDVLGSHRVRVVLGGRSLQHRVPRLVPRLDLPP